MSIVSRLSRGRPTRTWRLNNLERLLAHPAAREQLPHLLESRSRGLDAVLILATSQFFADTLTTYPEFLESIRTTARPQSLHRGSRGRA